MYFRIRLEKVKKKKIEFIDASKHIVLIYSWFEKSSDESANKGIQIVSSDHK